MREEGFFDGKHGWTGLDLGWTRDRHPRRSPTDAIQRCSRHEQKVAPQATKPPLEGVWGTQPSLSGSLRAGALKFLVLIPEVSEKLEVIVIRQSNLQLLQHLS